MIDFDSYIFRPLDWLDAPTENDKVFFKDSCSLFDSEVRMKKKNKCRYSWKEV